MSTLNRKERYLYLAVSIVMAVLFLVQNARSQQALQSRAQAETELRVQLSKAQAEILAQREAIADLKGQLLAARRTPAASPVQTGVTEVDLTQADLAALRSAGLIDPVAELIQSLEGRTDLIPASGILGGTMRFEPPSRWIISRPWVISPFSDGHSAGILLLRYEVSNGQIHWTRLDFLRE